jgi:hypothetical protein
MSIRSFSRFCYDEWAGRCGTSCRRRTLPRASGISNYRGRRWREKAEGWPPLTRRPRRHHFIDARRPHPLVEKPSIRAPLRRRAGIDWRVELSEIEIVSHFMSIPTVVARLRNWHGEAKAHQVAVLELQRARRARSRRRFNFWAAVAEQIRKELRNGDLGEPHTAA